MTFLRSIRSDLSNPLMLALLAAVGIAFVGAVAYALLGGGSSPPTVPSPPPATAVATVGPSVRQAPADPNEASAETTSGSQYQHEGKARNPFAPLVKPAAATTAAKSSPSTAAKTTAGSASGSSTTSAPTASAGNQSTSTATPAPVVTTPTKTTPKPTHSGLTPTQAYEIKLSLTDQGGGLNAIDSLERLSALPGDQQPLLIYLGVLKGGRDALFVVQPGTAVSGPGSCTPGPTDCEILSLKAGQIENLATRTDSGVSNVALFAVTAIKVKDYPSVAAASHARREISASGRALLDASTLPALSLFEYQPTIGAVVDLRNLAVGGEK